MGTIEKLGHDRRPEVILAEPVGSCTDLVGDGDTTLKRLLFDAEFSLARTVYSQTQYGAHPRNEAGAGFFPQGPRTFSKAVEEGRTESHQPCRRARSKGSTNWRNPRAAIPGRPILKNSARTGAGCEATFVARSTGGEFGGGAIVLDIEYDI